MNFGVFDRTTGHCVFARSAGNGPPEVNDSEQYLFMSTTYSVPDMMNKLEFNGVEVVEKAPVDPLTVAATWDQIESKRNEIRESPITIDSGLTFHADEDSFVLFENTIKHFNDLDELDSDGKLGWKDANKQYHPLSRDELIALRDELSLKRAKRASKLQFQAEILYTQSVTAGDLFNLETWGM